MTRFLKGLVVALLALALGGGGVTWYVSRVQREALLFSTAPVTRGDLVVTISATGTVEPEEVIDVGAQVAGQILSFGKDGSGKPIDYGSAVDEGTVLAQIDDSLYAAEAAEAVAQVQQAGAGRERAQADLEQMKAKLYQAQRDWERAQKLGPSEALAESSYDAYQSAYETAKANVAVDEAAIVQAQATLAQAQAALQRAQRNLSYCTIKSPAKGVIIDRRVNIGQTVVASLNAPSLFLLAKDLKRMQVWVAVNEADIGNIHPGQPVTFTVDAFPGRTFTGEVNKLRLNATMTQNVVTYTVEVTTDNSSGTLLPYLTANVQFELSRREKVLLAPNAALRWAPQPSQVAREYPSGRVPSGGPPEGGPGAPAKPAAAQAEPPTSPQRSRKVLWVEQGEYVRPISVTAGATDGTVTEVQGPELQEGMPVIVGEQMPAATEGGTTNPFTPQIRRSREGEQPTAGGQPR